MTPNPKVTVLMTVYNGEKYIGEAVESILNQTFTDFELLVINDGSTDNSVELLKSFNNSRIRLLNNEKNMGLVYSRNRGITEAKGKYISILDSDDIAYPTRLEEQVGFLENHPDVGVVSSWFEIIDENGRATGEVWEYCSLKGQLEPTMLFYNALGNSACTARKSALNNILYRDQYPMGEDYDFWVRVLKNCKACNLPKPLIKYRVHSGSISTKRMELMEECTRKVIANQLSDLGIIPTEEEMNLHRRFGTSGLGKDKLFIEQANNWMIKLAQANLERQVYSQKYFKEVLWGFWWYMLNTSCHHGLWIWRQFVSSPVSYFINPGRKAKLKLYIKCLLRWQKRS